jgi:hypothetical protein
MEPAKQLRASRSGERAHGTWDMRHAGVWAVWPCMHAAKSKAAPVPSVHQIMRVTRELTRHSLRDGRGSRVEVRGERLARLMAPLPQPNVWDGDGHATCAATMALTLVHEVPPVGTSR